MILKNNSRICLNCLGLGLLLISLSFPKAAGAEPLGSKIFARRAVVEYQQAKAQFQAATNGSPAVWIFARACYNLADFATNDENRAGLAIEGIGACRQLIKERPQSAPAHYYLGMNMGQLARTELIGALALVKEMEGEFKTAWTLDEQVDHGGPARSLGLLYRDAPGWPASIGNKRKAHEWLERAGRVDPNFPENPLISCESYLQWNEVGEARKEYQELIAIWPQARTNYTGLAWEHDWADWSARRSAVEHQLSPTIKSTGADRTARPPN